MSSLGKSSDFINRQNQNSGVIIESRQEVSIMDSKIKLEKQDDKAQMPRIVLNSQNSKPVREAMDRLSAQLMEKNRKLYERLAYK